MSSARLGISLATAYHIDFGANAGAYVDTFMRNIDWKGVAARYQDASKVEPLPDLVQKEFGDLPGVSVEEMRSGSAKECSNGCLEGLPAFRCPCTYSPHAGSEQA